MRATIDNGILRVLLSETETVILGLDVIFLDKNSADSENILKSIYKKASQCCGFISAENQLSVEIFPFISGGCEVVFSPEAKKTPVCVAPKGKGRRLICAEFYSFERLLKFIEATFVFKNRTYFRSQLYTNGSCYRLIAGLIGNSAEYFLLTDFADRIISSRYATTSTAEHWHELCRDNALEILGATFLKI